MLVLGLTIFLVILIVANMGVGFYNKLSPPCLDTEEYFNRSRVLPDGVSSSLSSIPSGTDNYYIGARTVPTGNPNIIGLTSYLSVHGNESTEGYMNPTVRHIIDDESDCRDRQRSESGTSKNTDKELDGFFQFKNEESERKTAENTKSAIVNLDMTMEGIQSRTGSGSKGRHIPTSTTAAFKSARDGYTSKIISSRNLDL